ncbi:MAG: CoA-binding protein [Burkholderiales bacterium]|jgi:predicted CoA-binding protein|nr:CoA-binding protein [Burkholderiales bacterium]MCE3268596.1 CoA-binding protein [Burkholderiales bacterium]
MDIQKFLASPAFAVIGASNNRDKFGNKVLRCFIKHKKTVYPIHPIEKEIEQLRCLKSVAQLPDTVESISIITPPLLTEKIIAQAVNKGIKNIWMQPGAASQSAIDECIRNGINVIANGPCILVELGC